jgi:predicted membrane GTPase involved in stress response
MTLSHFLNIVTKHVMDDPETFNALRQRFEMCEQAKSKAAAAALGYLIAIDEINEAQQSVWKTVFDLIDNMEHDSDDTTLLIFQAIYKWIEKELNANGYVEPNETCDVMRDMFADYIEPIEEEGDEL